MTGTEEQFSALFNLSSVAMAQSDPLIRHFVRVNQAMCRLTGYSESELLSMTVDQLNHPEDGWRDRDLFERLARRDGSYVIEKRYVRRDGSLVWVQVTATIQFGPDGTPITSFAVIQDISARKRAEEQLRASEERLKIAKDAAGIGIYDYDVRRGVLQWDARVRELWGAGLQDSVTYDTFMAGIHPEDRSATQAATDRALDPGRHGSYATEYRVINRQDGQTRWIAATGQPFFHDGKLRRVVGTAQDITTLKRIEEALKEADRHKNDFLAVLSHELRNPLAPIRNSLYVLDHAAPDGEQVHRAKQVIRRQLSHLSRLVDDLLDITRIARGKVQLRREQLDLADLLSRTVEDHRSLFDQNGIALEVRLFEAGPFLLNGDRTRIAQVFGNLLQNAAKFTDSGGTVVVSLNPENSPPEAVVRVRDTGVGVAPEVLPHIFEPFAQAETSLARSKGGLGLGLALVKMLVEMHGGRVSVSSEGAGKGAEVTIWLPLDNPGAPLPDSPARAPEQNGIRRILIIEDNVDAAESLQAVLDLIGHAVEVAFSGPEGLQKAEMFRPDVVLCDIGMPGMDGYEVARRFRQHPALQHIQLLALTGYTAPEDIERCAAVGFDGHLAKPLAPEMIQEVLSAPRRH